MARHPSESEEYLIARVLAYLLEVAEGIEFSRGVSDPAVLRILGPHETADDAGCTGRLSVTVHRSR